MWRWNVLPHFKSLSSDTNTVLHTCLDTQLITEFQARVNKLNVECHNKIKFQHVSFQEREWWWSHITSCSTGCQSHQKPDYEGKEKQEHRIKLHQHWNQEYYQPHITDTLLCEPKQRKSQDTAQNLPSRESWHNAAESNLKRFYKSL